MTCAPAGLPVWYVGQEPGAGYPRWPISFVTTKDNPAILSVFNRNFLFFKRLKLSERKIAAERVAKTSKITKKQLDCKTKDTFVKHKAPPPFNLSNTLAAYYSSIHEQLFLENLEEDLENFLQTTDSSTEVILLPPLSPRYRYLSHNLVQNKFPSLRSVSIGSDEKRRTVIYIYPQVTDSEKAVSTAKMVGHQDEKKGSISRGRGKRSIPLKQATQIQDDTSGSKRESQSKTSDKASTMRNSRGRGWKRPDQAIYVPRALRRKENIDSQSTEDHRREDKACLLTRKDEDIFAESDSFPEQESADRHYLARRHPAKDETAVSVVSSENQNCCDISDEKGTEAPVNGLSELSTASDSYSTEAELLDIIPKSVDISDLNQDFHKKKTLSERENVSENKQTEKSLSTEDDTSGKSCPERNAKEVQKELQKHEDKIQMGSEGGAEEIDVIDRCLSKPLVTPCAENERNGQKEPSLLENQDERESTNLDQQKPLVDTCQSNSSVEYVQVEDDKDNEMALKYQDIQKTIMGGEEKQQCLTSSANLVSDEPVFEGDYAKNEEEEFLKEFSKGLVEIETEREEEPSQATDASQSLSNNAEMNAEILDSCEVCPQECICMTSSEDADVVETDSMNDDICCLECSKETSSSNVSNNILMDLKNVSHEILNDCSEQNQQLGENSYSHEVKEVTSDVKDSSEKNESLSQKQEDEKELDNVTNRERQGSTESEQRKNLSDLDVGTKEEGKVDSDDVVNNEKSDEKEAKHKTKKKKKKVEENPKEEKKKKKSKKKESENEESKEKETDEKHKLKKKEKKKANKEDFGTKSKESKSKEKIKEKKEEKCKKGNEGNNDESWESKFDEYGECLDPELLEELTEATGIKKPSKHKTQFDYYSLPVKEVTLDDDSGYGHIVELYDFSPELKTQDLVQLLSSFKSQGYEIKWVDDTHALAVFSSEIAAKQATQMCSSPIIKLRPVSQGTPESKSKAKKSLDFLQPYKPRPQTTNLAAHRLVTGALGVRSTMSKEEREREREKIKEAKEQKRQEKQRKADIWGD